MRRETVVPNARAFVRSFNVLLKFARLYGLAHMRSAGQLEQAWSELRDCLAIHGETGLLLGVSGSQLLLDGEPLESTAAERSFAGLLTAAGVASIAFMPRVQKEEFANLILAFTEAGHKAGALAERLEKSFGSNTTTGIRVNEIRFVAEDSAFSQSQLAAQLTAATLGVQGTELRDWFRSPEKMIQLIAAAEGSHGQGVSGGGGGPGPSGDPRSAAALVDASTSHATGGAGAGTEGQGDAGAGQRGTASPSAGQSGAAGIGGGGARIAPLEESDMRGLLRLLAQMGEATQSEAQLEQHVWQEKLAALPGNAQAVLRQALANVAAKTPNIKLDEGMLLHLAEDLAIRFALQQFEQGEVRVNAVHQMLDRMGHEIESLRKVLRAREEKMTQAGLAVDSRADILDRQFWAAVPESGKRSVLSSPEAWCIPPRNVEQFVGELLARGDSLAAGQILSNYAACVHSKDPEARKKAAIGLGQLAGIYSRMASRGLQEALRQTGSQMLREKDVELETLLSAAFVRLSQEAASRRYFTAMQQALDSLADLEEHRPTWVQSLRPRIGIENRVAEFIDEALAAESLPEGFVGVLMRLPESAAEHLGARLGRVGRCSERDAIVEIAQCLGAPCKRQLVELLKAAPAAKAATAVGLLSRLDANGLAALLGTRLHDGRVFQDAVVRQLSIASAAERGQILGDLIESLDKAVVPLAIDEMGMSGDAAIASQLLQIAEGGLLNEAPPYIRVKAIEALGRLRSPDTAERLRPFVEARKRFGWAYPEEIRIAAAQALMKIDPEWMQAFLPKSGLDPSVVSLSPLDPMPARDVVRYRRYRRVRLPRSVPAVVLSARGKCSSAISVLSLEGGLLDSDVQLAVGTEATLKIPAGIRPISMQAVVRFVRSHQAGFETVCMGLEDRAKLRSFLVSMGGTGTPAGNPEEMLDPALRT